jgi:hypothetical protein
MKVYVRGREDTKSEKDKNFLNMNYPIYYVVFGLN